MYVRAQADEPEEETNRRKNTSAPTFTVRVPSSHQPNTDCSVVPDNNFSRFHQVGIGSLYAADAASSLCASFLVSPFITIVDRSIMQNASGAMKMGDSVRYGK